ncbi:MAG: ABC transporter substrate-binding protein [Chloroflexi bacterium]|nr:ABC transporter substrate-binding protein [Chloroflexota bacterium]
MLRKQLLRLVSPLVVLGLALAGCTPAAAPAPTPPMAPPAKPAETRAPAAKPVAPTGTPAASTAGQPKYGGSVTRLRENYPDILDPHLVRGAAWANDVLGPLYNGLFMLNENMEIVPDLVEKWEQPSDVEYVLRLRKGVRFHDSPEMKGRELTAEDVKFNIQRMATDRPQFFRAWQFKPVGKIETPDPYTVKLTIAEPTGPFMNFLAQPYNTMVGREAVEKFGDLSRGEAGTGPFYLKSWTEKVSYKLSKNPNYFIKGIPYLDEVTVIIVPDSATRLAAFRSSRADYILVSHNDYSSLKKANPKVTASSLPTHQVFMVFHPAKKPFDDQRVRQAFSLAIDRQVLIEIVMEGEAELSGPVYGVAPSWRLPAEELKRLYTVDIAKAKQFMAEAGYPNGFPLEVKVSARRKDAMDTLTVVAEQLKRIGIEVRQRVLEHTTLTAHRDAGDYLALLHGGTAALEPGERIPHYWRSKGQYHMNDPEVDRLLAEQQRAAGEEKRRQILNQFERLMIEKAYVAFLFGYGEQLVRQPHVEGPQQGSALGQHVVAYHWINR